MLKGGGMESIHGRTLKVEISLFVFFVLFLLSFSQAHAYPAPIFQSAMVYSSQNADGSINTVFFSRISGPSPEDVASFTATGPSGTFNLTSGNSFRELGLYYAHVYSEGSGVIDPGAYTFQVTDSTGRSATVVRDFAYDGTLPQVDSATMLPGNGSYIGTTTPTLSFDPVAGADYYQVIIWDLDYKAIWYVSQTITATSFPVPSGLLQPNTAYAWEARVWGSATNRQNRHVSNRFYFYTGTKAEPELTSGGVLSLPIGENLLNYGFARGVNVAPWDISYFRATGPDSSGIFNLADTRAYGFQFPAFNGVGAYLDPPTQSVPDGTYTVEIADKSGHIATSSINYTYSPVPNFSADSRIPADNTYFDTDTPSFSWARVTGDTGDGSYRYSIRIIDYANRIRWYDSPYGADTTFTLPGDLKLPRGSSYKWRVGVYGPGGTGANNYRTSGYRTFTINDVPSAPTLTVTISGTGVTLAWNAVPGATGYTLLYAPYPYSGTETIRSVDLGTKTELSATLWKGAAFYVAVQARNSAGSSGYSNIGLILIE